MTRIAMDCGQSRSNGACRQSFSLAASACASALAVALMAQPALAQDTASVGIEDIVVTARYRTESVQEIPQAIAAYGSVQLQEMNTRELSDLSAQAPNISILPTAFTNAAAAITIRGMGAAGIESTEESPVGIMVDGVFFTRPLGSMLDTFDLDRLEILRGPQGTSFGKNSLAGGISAHTKNPGADFGYSIEAQIGNYGRKDLKAAIDVPIVPDVLAVRVVGAVESVHGWFRNREDGSRIAKDNHYTARGTILFTPNEDVSLNVKVFKADIRAEQPGADTINDPTKLLAILGGWAEPDDGPYKISRNFPDEQTIDQWGAIANLDVSLGRLNLTSVTGYIETEDTQKTDYDMSPLDFFHQLRDQRHKQFSEELRLSPDFSDLDGPLSRLSLTVGGYYLRQSFTMSAAYPAIIFAPANQDVVSQSNTATALFGQAIYGLTDRLNVTFGIRQSWEKKNFLRDAVGVPLTSAIDSIDDMMSLDDMVALAESRVGLPGFEQTVLKARSKRSRTTMKAGFDYRFNDDVMGFFNFAQGYKGGGYGARAASLVGMGPTEDNTSRLFEAGIKGDFLDRTLRFNLTAFETRFKNLEFGVFYANPDVASGQETAQQNIGEAKTRGIELETMWRATPEFTLNANVGYLHNKFSDFCTDLNGPQFYTGTPVSDCGGKVTALADGSFIVDEDHTHLKLVRAPTWTISGGGTYTFDLGNSGLLSARGSVSYQSSYFTTVQNDTPESKVGSKAIVDGSLSWQSTDSRFQATLWAKNLTNKSYATGIVPTATLFIQRYWSAPRTFGLTLRVNG